MPIITAEQLLGTTLSGKPDVEQDALPPQEEDISAPVPAVGEKGSLSSKLLSGMRTVGNFPRITKEPVKGFPEFGKSPTRLNVSTGKKEEEYDEPDKPFVPTSVEEKRILVWFHDRLDKQRRYAMESYPEFLKKAKENGHPPFDTERWAIVEASKEGLWKADRDMLERASRETTPAKYNIPPEEVSPDLQETGKTIVRRGISNMDPTGKIIKKVEEKGGTATTLTPKDLYFLTQTDDVLKIIDERDPNAAMVRKMHKAALFAFDTFTGLTPVVGAAGLIGKGVTKLGGKAIAKYIAGAGSFGGVSAAQQFINEKGQHDLIAVIKDTGLGGFLPVLNKIPGIGKIEAASSKGAAVGKLLGQSLGASTVTAISDYVKEAVSGRSWEELSGEEKDNVRLNVAMMGFFHLYGGRKVLTTRAEAWSGKEEPEILGDKLSEKIKKELTDRKSVV